MASSLRIGDNIVNLFPKLLAKSYRGDCTPEYALLSSHVSSVINSANVLCSFLASSVAEHACIMEADTEVWTQTVVLAAALHDLGKANDHFQRAVREPNFEQGIRHEIISVIATNLLSEWLKPIREELPDWANAAIVFSIAGHHLKFPDPIKERPGIEVTTLFVHEDFAEVLDIIKKQFHLDDPPKLPNQKYSLLQSRNGVYKQAKRAIQELDREFSERERFLIAAVKTTLLCADLAGSALPSHRIDIQRWVKGAIDPLLNERVLSALVSKRLPDTAPLPFQSDVSCSDAETTLLEAGCGSGKTVAAYMWAASHANERRLFFCYPTTATASEGFAGYICNPDFEALLVHGRANIDYDLLDNLPALDENTQRLRDMGLEALEMWPIPAVVCTAHTVLGIMENVRRSLYAWPSIARAAFIFDEVHAFDDKLFTYMLRFLESFEAAPALLMTATLPAHRRQAIEEVANRRGRLVRVFGPREREESPRYLISTSIAEQVWDRVGGILTQGGKVLWICNTIKRAMAILDAAISKGLPVQPFHSRYRYRDRLARQRAVVDGFSPDSPAMLAVTTQVSEMSLDISADLLITELAPVPALIQRLGRLNRFGDKPDTLGDCLVISIPASLPYEDKDINIASDWLDIVCDGMPKSQKNLTDAFIQTEASKQTQEPAESCGFLDVPWRTESGKNAITEASHTIDIVMESDIGKHSPVEVAIPMPIPNEKDWLTWKREGRFLIVPDERIKYDEFRGATWNRT
ncbi:MAG: CRISPR-associated helicase Cas3' [Chloroflexota bacterium]|nr:CRISPR-associated helicase Cas3' [Chloroflexota bacterium]